MKKLLLLLLSLTTWFTTYAIDLTGTHILSYINHDIYQYATLTISAEGNTVTISNLFRRNQPITGTYDETAQTLTIPAGQLIDESPDRTKYYLYTYTVDENSNKTIDKTSDIVFNVKEGKTYNIYSSEQNMVAIDAEESSGTSFTNVSYRNYQNATLTDDLINRNQPNEVIKTEEYPVYVEMVGEGKYLIRNFDQESRLYIYTHRNGTVSTKYQDYPAFYSTRLKNYYYPVAFEVFDNDLEGAEGSGTIEDPYNVAGATKAVSGLKWTSTSDYEKTGDVYVKGKISRIANNGTYSASGTYGNASFYISDDGNQSNEFYCYRILYLDNTKYNEYTGEKVDIKVGDEVMICGKLMNYRGTTPETVQYEAYLYSLNPEGSSNSESAHSNIPSIKNLTPMAKAKAYRRKTEDMVLYGAFEGNILRINSEWAYYMDNRNNEDVDEEYRLNWVTGDIHQNTVITLDDGRFLMPHATHEVTANELLLTTKDNFMTAYQNGWMWSGDTSDDTNVNEVTNKMSTIEPGTDNMISKTTFPGLGIKNNGNAAKNVYMRVKGVSALKFYVTSNGSDERTAIVTATPTEGTAATKEVASNGSGAVGILEGLDAEKTYTIEFYTTEKDMTLYAVQLIGATTGIISINNSQLNIDNEAGAWYSIDGRKLNRKPVQKGIYIVNGKKVVI